MRRHPTRPIYSKLPTQLLLQVGQFLPIEDDLNYIIAFIACKPALIKNTISTLIDTKNHSTLETLLTKLLSTDLRIPSLPIFTKLANNHSLPHSLTLLTAHANYKSKALNQKAYWNSRDPFPTTTASVFDIMDSEDIRLSLAQASSENLNLFIENIILYIKDASYLRINICFALYKLNIITHILQNRRNDIDTKHIKVLASMCSIYIRERFFGPYIIPNLEIITELLLEIYKTLKRKAACDDICKTIHKTALDMLIPAIPQTQLILQRITKHLEYGVSHISHLLNIVEKRHKDINQMLFFLFSKISDQYFYAGRTDTALYGEIVSLLNNRAQLERNDELSISAATLNYIDNLPYRLSNTLSRKSRNRSEILKITLLTMIRIAAEHAALYTFQYNEHITQLIKFHQLYLKEKQKNSDFNPNNDQVTRALIKTLYAISKQIVNRSSLCKIVRFSHDTKELLLSSSHELDPTKKNASLGELIKLYISLSTSVMLSDSSVILLKSAIHLCATYNIDKETLTLLQKGIKQYNTIHGHDNPLTRYINEKISDPAGKFSYQAATVLISVVDSSLLDQDLIALTVKEQLNQFQELPTDKTPLNLIHALQTLILALSDHEKRQDVCNTLLSADNIKRKSWGYRIALKIPSFFATQEAAEKALAFIASNIQSPDDVALLNSLIREMHPRQYAPYINQIIAASLPLSYPQACQAVTVMRDGVKYLSYFDYLKLKTLFKSKEYNKKSYNSFKTNILELLQNARNAMSNGDFNFARKIQSCYRKHLENRDQSMPTLTPIEGGTFSQLMEYWASDLSWDKSNRKALIQHQHTLPSTFHSLTFRQLSRLLNKHFISDFWKNYPIALIERHQSDPKKLDFIQHPIPSIKECSDRLMKIGGGFLIGSLTGFIGCTIWALTPILTNLPQWGVITNSVFASLFMAATLLFTIYFAWHTAYYNEVLTKYKRTISSPEAKTILKACSKLNGFFSEYPLYQNKSSSRADCQIALAIRYPDASIDALGLTE